MGCQDKSMICSVQSKCLTYCAIFLSPYSVVLESLVCTSCTQGNLCLHVYFREMGSRVCEKTLESVSILRLFPCVWVLLP